MLAALRDYAAQRLWQLVYRTENHEVTAPVQATVTAGGAVDVQFAIDAAEVGGEIVTWLGIYDRNGTLWASEEVYVDPNATGEGTITYQVRFTIEAVAE